MLLYIANYLQEEKHACTQFNPQTHLGSQKQTKRNKRGVKTKVAADLDRSPYTHAYTQHRQVNT